jgi:hypothetical protein
VHARVPTKIAAAFRGRKHYSTQNVLAAVDFDMKFTYILVDAGYACRLGFSLLTEPLETI